VKRASRSIFVAVVAACLLGASATVASASPDSTSRCLSGCHVAGTDATISASLASTSTTTATYQVTKEAPALSAWAVFDGTTRLAGGASSTGTFTVDLGKTYNVYAVNAVTQSAVTTEVSPAAPVVEPPTASLDETIAPITMSDAVGSYLGNANVTLSASDGEGQGVSYIYYSVDGARVHLYTVGMVAQTSVQVAAPLVGTATHTITYWSQDKAGNVEAHKTSTFTVTAPKVTMIAPRVILAIRSSARVGQAFAVTGDVTPATAGQPIIIQYKKPGSTVWVTAKYSPVYTRSGDALGHFGMMFSCKMTGTWKFRARFPADATHSGYNAYDSIRIVR